MTGGPFTRVRWVFANRFTMWVVFVLVHLYLGYENLFSPSSPMGDVKSVYKFWMEQAFASHYWVGIDAPWVYPIVALLPMIASYAFGSALYASTWLSLVMILDAVALGTLTGWGRRRRNLAAGWWWVLFTLVLGPISLGRIDAVSVAVAILGVVIIAKHPTAASVLITIATWVKVWPAALVAAILIATRQRAAVLGSVIGTSAGIVAIALAFGSGANVLSFVTQQTGRGMQIEAPVATIWLWRALGGASQTFVYFDTDLLTYQISGAGDGVQAAIAIMTPLMALAVIAVAVLGIRAVRRGMSAPTLLPLLSLAFVLALIVFNKVGSPQYISWLAVPVVLAMATGGRARALFRIPAVIAIVLAGLTQIIYPYYYDGVLELHPAMLIVLSARNLLLVVLFVWTLVELAAVKRPSLGSGGSSDAENAKDWSDSAWSLGSRDPA